MVQISINIRHSSACIYIVRVFYILFKKNISLPFYLKLQKKPIISIKGVPKDANKKDWDKIFKKF